jgi:membrane protease YdiL (CAAX protease family)
MDRIRTKAFLGTIAALIGLEMVSLFFYRLSWFKSFTPLGWTGVVRGLQILLFFALFWMFSVPISTAGLKKFVRGSLVGLAVALILGSGFFLVVHLIRLLWGIDMRAFMNPGIRILDPLPLVILCLLGPFAEELFFRGLCYSLLRAHTGVWVAVALSSLFFGASHLLSAGALGVVLVPAVGGVVLALLYEFTGSLLAPFVLHALANFILFSRLL